MYWPFRKPERLLNATDDHLRIASATTLKELYITLERILVFHSSNIPYALDKSGQCIHMNPKSKQAQESNRFIQNEKGWIQSTLYEA